jgi:hypothetical protein
MQLPLNKFVYAFVVLLISVNPARAQNPNQANGYHASEAYAHGHEPPANVQNGYHASEARSHFGGGSNQSSTDWRRSHPGGDEGGFGSGFASRSGSNRERSSEGWGSRFGSSGRGQDSRAEEGIAMAATAGVLRRAIMQRNGQANGGATYGANAGGYNTRLASYGPMIGSRMEALEQSEQNSQNRRVGGFNTIYTDDGGRRNFQGGFTNYAQQ